jgi:hypothetical protein
MSLANIRAKIDTALATIGGIEHYPRVPSVVNPPCAFPALRPNEPVSYDFTAQNHSLVYHFYVEMLVLKGSTLEQAQDDLDQYLLPAGSTSIKAAVEAISWDSAWVSPTGNINVGACVDPALSYDGDIATFAATPYIPATSWSDFIELTLSAPIACNAIRYYTEVVLATDLIDVDIYYSGAWHNIFSGLPLSLAWDTKSFTAQSVTKARVRYYNSGVNPQAFALYEFMFYALHCADVCRVVGVTNYGPAVYGGAEYLGARLMLDLWCSS